MVDKSPHWASDFNGSGAPFCFRPIHNPLRQNDLRRRPVPAATLSPQHFMLENILKITVDTPAKQAYAIGMKNKKRTKNLCTKVILDALLFCGGAYHRFPGLQFCGYAFNKSKNHQWVESGKMVSFSGDAEGFDGFIDFVEHTLTDMKNGEKIFFDKPVVI
jgi:hypothetical protein